MMGIRGTVNEECWCQANNWELCFRTKSFGVLHCKNCGCYRIDPPPIMNENEGELFYTNYYNQQEVKAIKALPIKSKSRFWKVVSKEPSLNKVSDCVLDLGCGDGHLCFELKEAGWHNVLGIDISRSRIAQARTTYPQIEFFDVPLLETTINLNSVDLIVLDNVIEHIPNPVSFLLDLRPYLKAKGRIVIITPNMESGNFKLLKQRWTPELAPHTHIYLFTHKAMQRCLQEANFSTLHQGTFYTPTDTVLTIGCRFLRGDIKGALWKMGQDAGTLYSRLIQSGAMLYAVASPNHIT